MIRPKNFSGEGTDFDWGTYETNGETKCGSVVAAAMASEVPGSGVSGACAKAQIERMEDNAHADASRNMGFDSRAQV